MKRYALPLIILLVTVGLLGLVALGGTDAPNYSKGNPVEQSLSAEWLTGNPNARVVLMEYSDFQCPACRAYEGLLLQLRQKYADSVAFVYRQYPLIGLHPNADLAARATEAAGLQGKFWEMHDLVFERQSQWSKLIKAQPTFESYAQVLGLDITRFKADIESDGVKQAVADDYVRGQRAGVQGTPTFILNGAKLAENPTSVAEFEALLDQALGRK